MDISQLTDEQLNRDMNDTIGSGILNRKGECAVCDCARECPEIDEHEQKQYLTDWALTGPLMVENRIQVTPFTYAENEWNAYAIRKATNFQGRSVNPLRAICECLLLIHQAKGT